jgi:hypothetical protein
MTALEPELRRLLDQLLGLGVVLLPLSVQAQALTQARPNDAKGSRQEKIEILKKAIQILEEQEKAEQKKTPEPKKESPEVSKVRAEAKAAAAEVEAKRRELMKAEAKLGQLLRRLAELQGKDYRIADFVRPHYPSVGQGPDGARFGKYSPGPVKPKPTDKTPTELEQKFDRLTGCCGRSRSCAVNCGETARRPASTALEAQKRSLWIRSRASRM